MYTKSFISLITGSTVTGLCLGRCKTPEPYTTADIKTIEKIDTVFYNNGDWFAGNNVFRVVKETEPLHTWPFWLIIFVLVVIIVVSILWMRHHLLKSEAKESEAVLSLVKNRVDLVKRLTWTHEQTVRINNAKSYQDKLDYYQEIVRSYHSYLEELRNDLSFLDNVENALDASMNDIMSKARLHLGDALTEEDYQILACIFSGMKPSSIGFITGYKPGAIRTKKSRIKGRIDSLPSGKDKELLLEHLNNNT